MARRFLSCWYGFCLLTFLSVGVFTFPDEREGELERERERDWHRTLYVTRNENGINKEKERETKQRPTSTPTFNAQRNVLSLRCDALVACNSQRSAATIRRRWRFSFSFLSYFQLCLKLILPFFWNTKQNNDIFALWTHEIWTNLILINFAQVHLKSSSLVSHFSRSYKWKTKENVL